MDAFEETFTRIARIADVQKHRPDVMQRYLEDGKVVEIVDLLTGKILMMEQEKTRQLQEHSRHVHEQERSKQVCEQEKTKQMQIELEMMRLRVSMKKFDLV
jgi:uncharacterized secreted protein with C-terminal beta-propeller domain